MERYCGTLQPAIKSHRYPFASLDRFIVENAQLTQIKVIYNKAHELSLLPPSPDSGMAFNSPEYPTCQLLPPHQTVLLSNTSLTALYGALATRWNKTPGAVKKIVQQNGAVIEEWGRVRRVDSMAGDTIRSAGLGAIRDDSRDSTYVRVSIL